MGWQSRAEATAKVFGAGAFSLAGQVVSNPTIAQMVGNLWAELAQP